MTTESQKDAMRRYYEKRKATKRMMLFTFDKKDDADVIDKLDKVNRSQYITRLVREDIGKC